MTTSDLAHSSISISQSTILTFQILQLNSLRPQCESFCSSLRDALRAQLSNMKTLKPFVSTCYSEVLLGETSLSSTTKNVTDKEKAAISVEGEGKGKEKAEDEKKGIEDQVGEDGLPPQPEYEAGLGARFKFPGDSKKLREKSKTKLWRDYMKGEIFEHRNNSLWKTLILESFHFLTRPWRFTFQF